MPAARQTGATLTTASLAAGALAVANVRGRAKLRRVCGRMRDAGRAEVAVESGDFATLKGVHDDGAARKERAKREANIPDMTFYTSMSRG
jgi:hypothetical protein